VRSASGDDGRKLFQHVGHRGPVYKGLGAMNPCDHLHLQVELSRQMFEKYLNIKFNENASSGSRSVPCRRTDTAKLIVAFCNFAKAPKNGRTLASDTKEYQ
jgi:hypothetical protein